MPALTDLPPEDMPVAAAGAAALLLVCDVLAGCDDVSIFPALPPARRSGNNAAACIAGAAPFGVEPPVNDASSDSVPDLT